MHLAGAPVDCLAHRDGIPVVLDDQLDGLHDFVRKLLPRQLGRRRQPGALKRSIVVLRVVAPGAGHERQNDSEDSDWSADHWGSQGKETRGLRCDYLASVLPDLATPGE